MSMFKKNKITLESLKTEMIKEVEKLQDKIESLERDMTELQKLRVDINSINHKFTRIGERFRE